MGLPFLIRRGDLVREESVRLVDGSINVDAEWHGLIFGFETAASLGIQVLTVEGDNE